MATIEKLYAGTEEMVKDMMKEITTHLEEVVVKVNAEPSLRRGYVSRLNEAELWRSTNKSGLTEYWIVKPNWDSTQYCWKAERYRVANMFFAHKPGGEDDVFAGLHEARRFARRGVVYKAVYIPGSGSHYRYCCEGYL